MNNAGNLTVRFDIVFDAIDLTQARAELFDERCGGYASFEGWVRNHNDGEDVERLEYEIYTPLAVKEGARILAEACAKFDVTNVHAVHRGGLLDIGECAVWVGVSSPHRDEAFQACRYIIDEAKQRLPIWKKEHYRNGDSGWINCERCAESGGHHAHS